MFLWQILHLPFSNLTQVLLSCHHLPRLCTCVLKNFARFVLEESRIDYLLLFIDMLLDFFFFECGETKGILQTFSASLISKNNSICRKLRILEGILKKSVAHYT